MPSLTALRLAEILFLTATLICSSTTRPALIRPKQAILSLREGSKSTAPLLKQLQEASLSGTRSNEFPLNSVSALESRGREMRQADATTTAQTMETSQSTPATSEVEQMALQSQQQLIELLKDYYFNPRREGMEMPGNFMVYFDLFRTGPLSDDGDVVRSNIAITYHRNVCKKVARKLNTNRDEKDICHWTYECNFNENRFPPSIINATSCDASEGAKCVQRLQQVMTFTRTFNGAQAEWREAGLVSVVYGYTCRTT